jgi:predicted ATPase
MLVRLSQRLHLLKSELRSLPERQRTLYKTIAWSYDLLDPQEQWVFRRLSVFVGGCTFEAAEAVCQQQGEPESDISSLQSCLLDKSLLQQTKLEADEPRFVLLESTREYGLDCLREHNEIEAAQKAHALYYLALVEQAAPSLKGHDSSIWLDQLDQDGLAQKSFRPSRNFGTANSGVFSTAGRLAKHCSRPKCA